MRLTTDRPGEVRVAVETVVVVDLAVELEMRASHVAAAVHFGRDTAAVRIRFEVAVRFERGYVAVVDDDQHEVRFVVGAFRILLVTERLLPLVLVLAVFVPLVVLAAVAPFMAEGARRCLHDLDALRRGGRGIADPAEAEEEREHDDARDGGGSETEGGDGQARGTCPPPQLRGDCFNELRGRGRACRAELALDWRGATTSKESSPTHVPHTPGQGVSLQPVRCDFQRGNLRRA